MILKRRGLVLAGVLLMAGCSTTPTATQSPSVASQATPSQKPLELWALPDDPMGLTRKAGLEPLTMESSTFHAHAHLDVFKDGRPVVVPGGIGINVDDPGVEQFEGPDGPGYGGIRQPCQVACISPLHTHDPDGVLHTESPTAAPNTLGEFLIEWGVTLPDDAKLYIDGHAHSGDVAAIELTDMREIAIVMGEPPAVIPSEFPTGLRL
jgi:hypothetical protein